MARYAREFSSTGLYHIVFRGVNQQDIFEENFDFEKFLEVLTKIKADMGFSIYVYCLMTNHVHILLKEKEIGDISTIMKRLLCKYARWFNVKYKRSGALIANRYKSTPIEVDDYFLSVVRYIHQNPLKAKMVYDMADYKWSSYPEYTGKTKGITDKDFVLSMLPKKEFIEFHQMSETENFTLTGKVKKTDETIRREIIKKLKMEPQEISKLTKAERNLTLKELKNQYSIRELERVTGISRGIIAKC